MKSILFCIFVLSVSFVKSPYALAQTPQELFREGYDRAQYFFENGGFDAKVRRDQSIACEKTRKGQPVDTTIANLLLAKKEYVGAGAAMWVADYLKKNCSPR